MAWRRLGLIGPQEKLTQEAYVACITNAAEELRADGFFSEKTVKRYIEQAKNQDLDPAAAEI
jgi:hypothetical protein